MRVTHCLITCFSIGLVAGQPTPSADEMAPTTVASTVDASVAATKPVHVGNALSKRFAVPPATVRPPKIRWDKKDAATAAFKKQNGGLDAKAWKKMVCTSLGETSCKQGNLDGTMKMVMPTGGQSYAEVSLNQGTGAPKQVRVLGDGSVVPETAGQSSANALSKRADMPAPKPETSTSSFKSTPEINWDTTHPPTTAFRAQNDGKDAEVWRKRAFVRLGKLHREWEPMDGKMRMDFLEGANKHPYGAVVELKHTVGTVGKKNMLVRDNGEVWFKTDTQSRWYPRLTNSKRSVIMGLRV